MVVQLPAVPGVRNETLLTNVYFPVGSQSAEFTRSFFLLTQLAEYAVSHKANILAGGDWNAVTPGNRRCRYRDGAPRQDSAFLDWLSVPIGPPGHTRLWRHIVVEGYSYIDQKTGIF